MIDRKRHADYIKRTIETRDILYYLTEPIRSSTVYWSVNSLRMLNDPLFADLRIPMLDFIKTCANPDGGFGGNSGSSSSIVTTFTALQIIYLYGVPYYSTKTVQYILGMQQSGSRFANDESLEQDTRIDCCAILSLHLLYAMHKAGLPEGGDFAGLPDTWHAAIPMDRNLLNNPIDPLFMESNSFDCTHFVEYILSCYNSDGGFGNIPGAESHAAQTFCCLSALRSLDALALVDQSAIEDFLAFRQHPNGGLDGRINKKEDVCYSFWVLAALRIIGSDALCTEALRQFIFLCQDENGGFSDRQGNECDLYHQMFSLASLSLIGKDDISPIDPGFAL